MAGQECKDGRYRSLRRNRLGVGQPFVHFRDKFFIVAGHGQFAGLELVTIGATDQKRQLRTEMMAANGIGRRSRNLCRTVESTFQTKVRSGPSMSHQPRRATDRRPAWSFAIAAGLTLAMAAFRFCLPPTAAPGAGAAVLCDLRSLWNTAITIFQRRDFAFVAGPTAGMRLFRDQPETRPFSANGGLSQIVTSGPRFSYFCACPV